MSLVSHGNDYDLRIDLAAKTVAEIDADDISTPGVKPPSTAAAAGAICEEAAVADSDTGTADHVSTERVQFLRSRAREGLDGKGLAMKDQNGRHAGGRPRFQPTDEQRKNVKILVALGIPERAICAIVRDHKDRPISEKTLRKHFRKEIEMGATELNSDIGAFMVATILGREPPSGTKPIDDDKIRGNLLDLYARSRLGWSTTVRNEISNADGKPFVYVANKTDAKL